MAFKMKIGMPHFVIRITLHQALGCLCFWKHSKGYHELIPLVETI